MCLKWQEIDIYLIKPGFVRDYTKTGACFEIDLVKNQSGFNLSAHLQDLEQQRHRPACTFVQSDQHLCYSLIEKYCI